MHQGQPPITQFENYAKKSLLPHGKWSELHPKSVNVNKKFAKMKITIFHKMVILCQCMNIDVDSLLVFLGAWIVVFVGPYFNFLGLFKWLHLTCFY